MRDVQFDAFGEVVSDSVRSVGPLQGRASKIVLRAGVGLFWSLVVVIVAARVATFDPDFARSFGTVAANLVRAVVNV